MIDNAREMRRIERQFGRETNYNLGKLTLAEWIETLEHFNERCAYNQEHPYEVIEHFKPISDGGTTNAKNCVPACKNCNARKSFVHPESMRQSIELVGEYLASRQITHPMPEIGEWYSEIGVLFMFKEQIPRHTRWTVGSLWHLADKGYIRRHMPGYRQWIYLQEDVDNYIRTHKRTL